MKPLVAVVTVASVVAMAFSSCTPSPDGRGWFVMLSREFSPRMWC